MPEHFYLVDFIPGLHSPTKIDVRSVVRLYLEGLSAQQVAERLDISKQAVLARLRRFDVRKCRRGRAPDNFRYVPPYGQKVWGRRLVLNKKEIGVVRPVPQIGRTMGISRQSIQRTADLLVRDGLCEFVDNPHHQKSPLLRLTKLGEAKLSKMSAIQIKWANGIASPLDTRKIEVATTLLKGLFP